MRYKRIAKMVREVANTFEATPVEKMKIVLQSTTAIYIAQMQIAADVKKICKEEHKQTWILPGYGECCKACYNQEIEEDGSGCQCIRPMLAKDGKSCQDIDPMEN